MALRIMQAILNVIPYMVSGFSAPFIFRAAPTPQTGGHYAGALFMFAGIWAVGLSFKHDYAPWAKGVALIILMLNLLFWGWRFLNSAPLKEATLLGINGGAWHGLMTSLYLVLLVILFVFEFKRSFPRQ